MSEQEHIGHIITELARIQFPDTPEGRRDALAVTAALAYLNKERERMLGRAGLYLAPLPDDFKGRCGCRRDSDMSYKGSGWGF